MIVLQILDIKILSSKFSLIGSLSVIPSKIDGFRPNLLFSEPVWEDGLVKYDGTPYPIVHQYDRVPFLKKFVQEKFEQRNNDEYLVFNTAFQ